MTTILTPGDIASVGYTTNGTPDSFAFVNLVPLAAGTTIYFTDNGWTGTGFLGVTGSAGSGSEGLIRFVANAAIPAGTMIRSSDTSSSFTWTTSGLISAGAGNYAPIDLAGAGDQITAV